MLKSKSVYQVQHSIAGMRDKVNAADGEEREASERAKTEIGRMIVLMSDFVKSRRVLPWYGAERTRLATWVGNFDGSSFCGTEGQ